VGEDFFGEWFVEVVDDRFDNIQEGSVLRDLVIVVVLPGDTSVLLFLSLLDAAWPIWTNGEVW